MATESRMSTRRGGGSSSLSSPGPFLAEVTSHLDPTYMGGLEVALVKTIHNTVDSQENTFVVKYLSPFYGVTSPRFEGNNSSNFNDVQKSYGMWCIPPDVGTIVMVIFVDGDPNQGYWMGCVPDQFQNHMVPGIAASQNSAVTSEQLQKYGTTYLPVAEYLKSTQNLNVPNVDTIKKPVHPFADRLVEQGLLLDTVRGVTSSGARREVPSSVFGISTPGPLDTSAGAKTGMIGYEQKRQAPVSRLGGTTFVMDDGDINGQNELVRIRTRTGHQILMHNSQDLIYIGNSKGSAWIELTSNGKIDIFSQDSISIHSEQDFNFRADRDINFEAGRNIHMNAFDGIEVNCKSRFYLICDANGKMIFGDNLSVSTGDAIKISAGGNINTEAGGTSSHASAGAFSIGTADNLICGASGTLSLGASGNIIAAGAQIHLNGPAAPDPIAPDSAEVPEKLDIFALPNREISYGWGPDKFYNTGTITTIMQRVPTHEPWPHHENVNPEKFTPASTNVVVTPRTDSSSSPTAPPPADGSGVSPPINDAPVAAPLKGKAADNEQYLQATLIANGVTDPIKLAAWMAQCKVESDHFRALREYASGAEYEGRTDLGNRTTGDGVKYKGRGFIQLTGRDVYRKMTGYFKAGIDFEQQPDLVEGIEWASKSVLYFFNVYKPKGFKNRTMTQPYQDTTAFWDDPLSVTALVNGGKNAYEKRKQYYAEYKAKFEKDGVKPSGIVGTGSGGIVTDSNGRPIKSGS